MYFIGLIIDILTHADFGLSPFGVVRLRQTIVQHERISLSTEEKFDLTARLTEYRQTQKGIEFDIKFEMSNERHVTVWESLGTFISRNKATQKRQHQPRNQQPLTADSIYADEIRFDVAGNCGIEYAKISGDYNPYHLYPFTARLLGYPKPMAHGLWTATRSLVEIAVTKNLEPTRFVRELYVEFKRPLFIPSQVALRFGETDSLVYSFRVESAITGEPNLIAQAKFS
ncbi:3-hydroxyacyl-thioester dehydratase X-like [Oscarella lobularis]|uniref:3-hydroxyacyl-thioester dehydratase X-like n=1 Tax=Oscarella lobularis TaxID=121494 RepID=UPI00331438F3